MHSCIYEGRVWHRRNEPVTHQFQKRLFMVYLDLDELPGLVGRGKLIGERKWTTRAFLRSDHLFDPGRPLADEVRAWVTRETGHVNAGPIRLLTQLRYFGHYLSPLNIYYLFDETGHKVQFAVAEVNNTPWDERHCYTLWEGNRTAKDEYAHAKDFHVSPFLGMDLQYRWSIPNPGENLQVNIANYQGPTEVFRAGMSMHRRELSRSQLRRMTTYYPLMTTQILLAIYYQALQLWWKRCPFYKHPKKLHRNSNPLPSLKATSGK